MSGSSDAGAAAAGLVRSILLASHDTPGARAAEAVALALAGSGGEVTHLVVVPEFWKGMRGDDWLNNAITQDRFGTYLEEQIGREIEAHVRRVQTSAEGLGIAYRAMARQGDIARCVAATAAEIGATLVVLGAPRPKGMLGFQSRLDLDRLAKDLRVPYLLVPHPDR